MTVAAGTRFGPYEIMSALGAGGMGEVYRARDTRLNRVVAIKLLPPRLAGDPRFRERFAREARSISALNHPNICTLFDVGEITTRGAAGEPEAPGAEIVSYLVMEYIDGETLAARLGRSSIPVPEALKVASEIASALDKAHRSGIVHRDLKPGNVMLTKAGAKLLDFGLAKTGSTNLPALAGQSALETITAPPGDSGQPLTEGGTVLGTFQYMAPEQVEGKEADARTDIFAFGSVLFEMLTGRRAFHGESQANLIGAILKDEPPPVSQAQPAAPPALDHLVQTCLAKDPEDRFQAAHDLLLQLHWISHGSGVQNSSAPLIAPSRRVERTIWAGVIVAVAVITGIATWSLRPTAPLRHIERIPYFLPENQSFDSSDVHNVAMSPDGTKVVYVANQQLYLRAQGQLEAQPIQGTDEDPHTPVFSPDGQWIAYVVQLGGAASTGVGGGLAALLKKVPTAGGVPKTLARLDETPLGVSWAKGSILFGENLAGKGNGIRIVSDEGGEPRMLISVDGQSERAAQPQLLDDGKHVVFTVVRSGSSEAENQIVVQAVDGGERHVLINGGADPHILPTGHLVYIHNATVLVVPFDARRLSVKGEQAVPIVDGVSQVGSSGQFSVSDEGRLVYLPGSVVSSTGSRALVWVSREGDEEATGTPLGRYLDPRLSPDRKRLAVSSGGDILIWTFSTGTLENLTFDAPIQFNPAWMPNSQHVVFDSSDGGQTQILRKAIDGTGPADVLSRAPAGYPESVAPGGELLTYHTPGNILMLLPLAPRGPARPLVQTNAQTLNAEISPDGRWIAYQANDSGRFEIYVRPYPVTDAGIWKVSSAGGTCPLWSRNSDELFYLSGPPSQLTAVKVMPGSGPAFTYGKSESLFPATRYLTSIARSYDLSPDGSRFIMIKAVTGILARRPSLVFVSDWPDALSGKVAK